MESGSCFHIFSFILITEIEKNEHLVGVCLEHYHCRWLDNLRGIKRSVELELMSVFCYCCCWPPPPPGSVVNFEESEVLKSCLRVAWIN